MVCQAISGRFFPDSSGALLRMTVLTESIYCRN
jgi:hypothetical protein